MTKPRYPQGCAARSQVPGQASAGYPDNAWNVNFNHGNSNINHQNNTGYVLAVRSGPSEYQGVTLQQLHKAWKAARRQKSSHNQLSFDAQWLRNLQDLLHRLNAGDWRPQPSLCFIATRPKAREIHAPDFADRIVHHWLVPQLEAIYEPRFIHHSYANRKGKGTHKAVQALQDFARETHSGQGGGWYLQLDIHNFFNSIHRPTLWAMLKPALQRAGLPGQAQHITHALLSQKPTASRVRATAAELAQVPPHKRLCNAAPGCGLPIGNLSSQFFANVYLDALDQFVKHQLKAKRYLRYVDDFVLVHESREQLLEWQGQIEQFLHKRLRLKLKADIKLRPLTQGVDFLGYIIHPTHTTVRRRVISHAREALWMWQQRHVSATGITTTPAQLEHLRSVHASYQGHFRHANSHRLSTRLHQQFPWLANAVQIKRRFDVRLMHKEFAL